MRHRMLMVLVSRAYRMFVCMDWIDLCLCLSNAERARSVTSERMILVYVQF